jgi:hypothetical protein
LTPAALGIRLSDAIQEPLPRARHMDESPTAKSAVRQAVVIHPSKDGPRSPADIFCEFLNADEVGEEV